MSDSCYPTPPILPNLCGECSSDADCADSTGFGCTPPNPLPGAERGAVCGDGSLGSGCETTDACQDGFTCEELLNIESFMLVLSACSECGATADCETGEVCGLDLSVSEFSGQRVCQTEGSVPNDSFCDDSVDGDLACMSGFCETVDIEGLLQLDVCGACNLDTGDGCATGEECVAGSVDISTFAVTGTSCQPV